MNTNEMYALADVLQMPLTIKDRSISGHSSRDLMLGDHKIPLENRIITSYAPFSGCAAMIRLQGQLGLFATVEGANNKVMVAHMLIIDLSKLIDNGVNFFENLATQPQDVLTMRLMVLHATIANFRKTPGKDWEASPT